MKNRAPYSVFTVMAAVFVAICAARVGRAQDNQPPTVPPGSTVGAAVLPPPPATAPAAPTTTATAGASTAAPTASSSAPVSPTAPRARSSPWSLLGDANIQAVNFKDTSAAFGVGLSYNTKWTDLSFIIRKGTESSLDASEGNERAFGAFILSPQTSSVSATAQWLYFGGLDKNTRGCTSYKEKDTTDEGSKALLVGVCHGPFTRVSVGTANWTFLPKSQVTDPEATTPNIKIGVLAAEFTAGYALSTMRVEPQTVDPQANIFLIYGYAAATTRTIGGDIASRRYQNGDASKRTKLLTDAIGTSTLWYPGVEVGGGIRINDLDLVARFPVVFDAVHSKNSIAGLTGGQFLPVVEVRMPIKL